MRSIKVVFSDGDYLYSDINGTEEEIKSYYIGNKFNIGRGDKDLIKTATDVIFLN